MIRTIHELSSHSLFIYMHSMQVKFYHVLVWDCQFQVCLFYLLMESNAKLVTCFCARVVLCLCDYEQLLRLVLLNEKSLVIVMYQKLGNTILSMISLRSNPQQLQKQGAISYKSSLHALGKKEKRSDQISIREMFCLIVYQYIGYQTVVKCA